MPDENVIDLSRAAKRRSKIDWTNPDAQAIDGFTVADIVEMIVDSLIPAVCAECGARHHVEADADGYDCQECYAPGAVTSPLIKLGFV